MVFVLTNDDGIDAPGIKALYQAVQQLGHEAIVVAPLEHHSGCGHQVTTNRPIQVQQRSDWEYAIQGTPVDCVRLALSHLCPNVEMVLSGINFGGNLGSDVYISGTVAAVREASLHRIPGIALSHYRQRNRDIDWEVAVHRTVKVLSHLLSSSVQPGAYLNVNLPHLPEGAPEPKIVHCSPCSQPLPAVYRVEANQFYYSADYSKRPRDPNADVDVCFAGYIAVTELRV